MFSCNHIQYLYIFSFNCVVAVFFVAAIAAANGQNEQSNIVFSASYLKRQRSFDVLTSNAVTTKSVIELSHAAEAFSLEYFQVIYLFDFLFSIITIFISNKIWICSIAFISNGSKCQCKCYRFTAINLVTFTAVG